MKKDLILALAAALIFSMPILSACGSSESDLAEASKESGSGEDVWQTVSEAYLYTFPLVLMDVTKTLSTNTEQIAPEKGRAPVNQLMHGQRLADASFRTIVSPNVDTVYSQAWYDLGDEPMVYVLPETDRFCNVQILDAWTNTVCVFDQAGSYAIVHSAWEGDLPEGLTRIDVPTMTAWSITRTVLSGEEDLPNVRAIQEKMKFLPLSAYVSGGEYSPAKGSYTEENDYVPVEKILSMGPKAFFDKANALMKTNPPANDDAGMMEKLAAIKVGPGMVFDPGILSGDVAEQWKKMIQSLAAELENEAAKFSVKMGQWKYFGAPIGDFGTAYTYRAAVALGGLGANTVDVALYLRTGVDDSGEALTAEKSYVMRFETLPPIMEGGFWSLTAYGSDNFLIDNPIDRYCINDRTNFVLNEDGSLDILLSRERPEDSSNWLPVSGENYHFILRIYTPDMDALSTWQPPVICVV